MIMCSACLQRHEILQAYKKDVSEHEYDQEHIKKLSEPVREALVIRNGSSLCLDDACTGWGDGIPETIKNDPKWSKWASEALRTR